MLRHAIGTLLILQVLLLGHLLLQTSDPTAHAIQTQGGQTTHVTLTPPTPWGGAYGTIGEGTSTLTIAAGGVARTDLAYHDDDNNCSKTELIATTTDTSVTDIGPIEPYWADQRLGIPSTHPFSTVQMFNELHTFELAGTPVQLWSLRTRGELRDFIQGIGQSDGNLVFVTRTMRNAQSYNGEPANYQLLLPSGAWSITYDYTDSCSLLDEYTTQTHETEQPRLDAAMPERICTGQENTFHSVHVQSRIYCTPQEVGEWYCQPADAEATISRDGEQVHSQPSGENGSIKYVPSEDGRYELQLNDGNQTLRKSFSSAACGEHGDLLVSEGRYIEYPGIQINPPPDSTQPRREAPDLIGTTVAAEYVLITVLSIITMLLGTIGYWHSHKDDSIPILKLRVWLLERLR